MENPLLEVNLISAQDLKSSSSSTAAATTTLRRRIHTYAVAWIDSSTTKLRTRVDREGSNNPTWNDKFLFKLPPAFLSSETSAFNVEIYSVGILTDSLLGSARVILSNFLPFPFPSPSPSPSLASLRQSIDGVVAARVPGIGIPAFCAVQIRRPSGRFHGVLNLAAMVVDGSDLGFSLNGASAVGYRDLVKNSSGGGGSGSGSKKTPTKTTPTKKKKVKKEANQHRRRTSSEVSGEETSGAGSESFSFSGSGSPAADFSDGSESTASTSSTSAAAMGGTPASAAAVLKEANRMRDDGGTTPSPAGANEKDEFRGGGSGGLGFGVTAAAAAAGLCGLGITTRKIHISPSDENIKALLGFDQKQQQKKG